MSSTVRQEISNPSPVQHALRRAKGIFLSVGLFSGTINVLALTGSLYMLQIYDRVLPSQSVPTLVGLTILLFGLYAIYGALDLIRIRIMGRVGITFDRRLREPVYRLIHALPFREAKLGDALQPLRDLDQIRTFLSGLGPPAFLDLPWVPIYLLAVYLMHPVLGMLALFGAIILVSLTAVTEFVNKRPTRAAAESGAARQAFGEATRRNAEVINAMGLGHHLNGRWRSINERYVTDQLSAFDAVTRFGTMSKVFRLLIQSGMLGLGAYLVILGEVTAGVIIAASIITSRALAPIEMSIGHWREFVAARQGYQRLNEIFATFRIAEAETLALPSPKCSLKVSNLSITPPGASKPVIRGIDFELKAGDGLGIIGPSAGGKSTLVRAIVGLWGPGMISGSVRLDGASLTQWPQEILGRHIGYLPQDVELLSGTVAENISRFDPAATSDAIVAAAKMAGVHDMIVHLADGYQTQVGESGRHLSAGQCQRVALARALYDDPFLVVLDEPNSNLDASGEAALSAALKSVRERGGIAIIVAHRPSALAAVDQILALSNGQVIAFGRKDDVLRQQIQPARDQRAAPVQREAAGKPSGPPGLKIVPERI